MWYILKLYDPVATNLILFFALLRELQYKKSQELYEGRTTEKNTAAEIQGSRAASRNLSSRINKLDHDSLKQQEIIYNQVWLSLIRS